MKFDFMPYLLGTDIHEFKYNLIHKSNDNGIESYMVKKLPVTIILKIPIRKITLYFLEDKLITSYMQLNERNSNQEKTIRLLERYLKRNAMGCEEDNGFIYYWENREEFLGIVCKQNQKKGFLYLYNTLKEYNIFNQ